MTIYICKEIKGEIEIISSSNNNLLLADILNITSIENKENYTEYATEFLEEAREELEIITYGDWKGHPNDLGRDCFEIWKEEGKEALYFLEDIDISEDKTYYISYNI